MKRRARPARSHPPGGGAARASSTLTRFWGSRLIDSRVKSGYFYATGIGFTGRPLGIPSYARTYAMNSELPELPELNPEHATTGTEDDEDDRDDEHAGENEASVRETDENTETPEEFEIDDEDEDEEDELGHPEDDADE